MAVKSQTSERWWRQSGSKSWRKELAPYLPRLDEINAREAELQGLADEDLTRRARDLRQRARAGEDLDALLPECFALVRETARRALGERPYEVQLLAGIAMHEGRLVEMQTGEGKTLAAVAPVVLNALTGRGVHVLTYNDYLARRDAAWMGPVYQRLGLTVGCVQEGFTPEERQRAYGCDVTYVTVKEAGFDHLRDGLCLETSHQVQRPFRSSFHWALVDEADSLLIDEARIPLVIAGRIDETEIDLPRITEIARRLERGVDFDLDEYARNISLTDRGAERAEAMLLHCENLFAPENVRLLAELRNALHAEVLLRRDVDYIVRDGRIELVDELTGRVAENRLWPDGLQAALEAKEGLLLQPEGRSLDSITIQLFLQKYPRLCGMTGTARPAAHELQEVYGLGVLTVPTHRPSIRIDHPDVVFGTREAKRQALLEEIASVHATGRPILVGTVSVEESERLAADLREKGIACRVLNARNDAEEAEIVARAGALGAVRDEVYIVQLDGRDPFTELCRAAGTSFEALMERIEDGIVETFERVEITADGVDWEREGLLGPSSTWTYLVNDNVFSGNTFLTLSVRASFGLWAALVCWPLLLVWAAARHWRRWRQREPRSEDGPS